MKKSNEKNFIVMITFFLNLYMHTIFIARSTFIKRNIERKWRTNWVKNFEIILKLLFECHSNEDDDNESMKITIVYSTKNMHMIHMTMNWRRNFWNIFLFPLHMLLVCSSTFFPSYMSKLLIIIVIMQNTIRKSSSAFTCLILF